MVSPMCDSDGFSESAHVKRTAEVKPRSGREGTGLGHAGTAVAPRLTASLWLLDLRSVLRSFNQKGGRGCGYSQGAKTSEREDTR